MAWQPCSVPSENSLVFETHAFASSTFPIVFNQATWRSSRELGKRIWREKTAKMVKITVDLIEQCAQYTNTVKDREIDLRGYKISVIENMGATLVS